jgi:hypothetical protein
VEERAGIITSVKEAFVAKAPNCAIRDREPEADFRTLTLGHIVRVLTRPFPRSDKDRLEGAKAETLADPARRHAAIKYFILQKQSF